MVTVVRYRESNTRRDVYYFKNGEFFRWELQELLDSSNIWMMIRVWRRNIDLREHTPIIPQDVYDEVAQI